MGDEHVQIHHILLTWKWAFNIFRILFLIEKEKVEIIHSFLYGDHYLDAVVFRCSRARVYITVRRNLQHWRKKPWLTLGEKFRNRLTTLVIANSAEARLKAIDMEHIDNDRIIVIPNGIEDVDQSIDEKQSGLFKERIGYMPGDFVIASIANLKPVKRQEDVLRSLNLLRGHHPIIKFVMIGRNDEGYEHKLRELVRQYRLEAQVFFLGFTTHVGELLSFASVSIISSEAEGFPNAILESFLYGVPVIATEVGGNKEVVRHGNNGYLYKVGDIQELANIISKTAADPESLKEMGMRCRRDAAEKYSIRSMIQNYEQVYDRLLENEHHIVERI